MSKLGRRIGKPPTLDIKKDNLTPSYYDPKSKWEEGGGINNKTYTFGRFQLLFVGLLTAAAAAEYSKSLDR